MKHSVFSLLLASLRKRGLASTIAMVVMDLGFDVLRRVDTASILPVDKLNPDNLNLLQHASPYQATNAWIARKILRAASLDLDRISFVDFGSGKGRVLIIGAEMGFDAITGIEFSPALSTAAAANLERLRKSLPAVARIRLLTENAAESRIDDGTNLFFFYNPFDEHIMRAVLGNIIASLEQHPREVRIAYVNPTLTPLLQEFGFRQIHQVTSGRQVEGMIFARS